MRIAFNPSTVAALIAPPNNKDITFDLRGHNIFARGVKFCGTDTNTWRDIKINNVSIGSNTLDLRDGDNTTLTNINGVVTINSTWRPVVDNLTSDSTTSSLSANLGRILKALIDGKSDSGHNHDDRYLRLTGGWMSGDINFGGDNKIYWGRNTDSASISFKNDGDADSYMSFVTSDNGNEYFRWSHSSGSTNTEWMALRSDGLRVGGTKVSLEGHSHNDLYYTKTEVNNKLNGKSDTGHTHDNRYLKLTGGTMQLGEGLKFHADDNYFGTYSDARIISLLDGNDKICDGGLIIDERATLDGKEYVTELLRIRDSEFKWKGSNILHSGNSYINGSTITINGSSLTVSKSDHTHSWQSITDKIVGGNEFNIVNAGFNAGIWFNYVPINDRSKTATIKGYNFGNGAKGYAFVYASGFVKTGSSSSYVLLGDGGHKAISDFMSSTIKYALSDTIGGNALLAYKLYYPSSVLEDLASIDNFHETRTFKYGLWLGNSEGMGSSFPGTYNGIILSGGWASAKYGFQLAIDDNPNYFIALRQRGNGTWSTWKQIPMGDGTGASGTWGINITGSAGSVAWGNITGKPSSFTPTSHNHSFTLGATTITTGETRTAINGPFAIYTNASAKQAFSIYRDNVYEGVKHWVDDGMYHIEYTNDEAISNIAIRLIDTDMERATNKGADAKDVTVYLDCYRNFYPSSNNTGNIGISSRRWANMYATTFHGLLDGNATTATNSDTLDGYHANGLLTALSNSNNGISVTVGGTTKSISNISVNYASSAGNADTVDGQHLMTQVSDWNTDSLSIFKSSENLTSNAPTTDFIYGVTLRFHRDISYYHTDLVTSLYHDRLFFRRKVDGGYQTWRELIHSGNIGSQSVSYANSAGNADTLDGFHATSGNSTPWGTIPVITTSGYMDIGKHLEFHYDNSTGSDYSTALMCLGNYSNIVYLPAESGTLALTSQVLTWKSLTIDMRNYDESYWHPVTVPLPYTGYNKIKVSVLLNIGDKPSWAEHPSGITCNMEIWATSNGWGTTYEETICLNYTHRYCSLNPCGWMLLGRPSLGVLFLRGGTRYIVYTDFDAIFTPYDKTYTWINGSYSLSTGGPYTSCPGLNFNKNIIYANLDGNSSSASKLVTPRSIWGQSFDGTGNVMGNLNIKNFDILGYNDARILQNLSGNLGINPLNNVGIGTISPAYKLHVAGDIYTTTGFKKNGSSDSYVLLGGGGHKAISDFASSSHGHNYAANENYGGFTKSGRLPISGFYQSDESESGGNAPWSSWVHLINCLHSNTNNNFALLIAASFFDNNTFKIRVTNNDVNNDWRDIIHSGNIGSQTVANAYHLRINSANTWSTWYWAGLSGLPSWLWGSNDGTNMYVWDPNNFNVNTALYLRSLGNLNCQTGRTLNYGDVYSYNTYDGNTGSPTTYSSVIGFGRGTAGTVEIAGGWCNSHLYWRSLRDCCDDWYSWRVVLDSSNYTEFINNYYWANVKISTSSSTTTSPTVHTLTATRVCAGHNPGIDNSISCSNWFRSSGATGWYNTTYSGGWYMSDTSWIRAHNNVGIYTGGQIYSSNSIRMSNILLEHTDEINNITNGNIYLNFRNSGNVSLCEGGGKVGIGTTAPSYKLDVNGSAHIGGTLIINSILNFLEVGAIHVANKTIINIGSDGVDFLKGVSFNDTASFLKSINIRTGLTEYNAKEYSTSNHSVIIGECLNNTTFIFEPASDGLLLFMKLGKKYSNIKIQCTARDCIVVKADNFNILIGRNTTLNIYGDGVSRFFIYEAIPNRWIEFRCG